MGAGSDVMFTLVPIFIGIIACLVIGTIVVGAVKGFAEWSSNNAQPVLTVPATVVCKRTHVRHSSGTTHHHADGHIHHDSGSTSTTYYVTFQLDSGERLEFDLRGDEWGLLVEGDTGQLTHQGTRYQGFTRERSVTAA